VLTAVPATTLELWRVPVLIDVVATKLPIVPVLAFTPPADHILPVLIAVAVAVPDTVSDPALTAVPATTLEL
jgi:hypothetical protein